MGTGDGEGAVADGEPTRFVEPERMSPAARTPGNVVSRLHGSRSFSGHRSGAHRVGACEHEAEFVAGDGVGEQGGEGIRSDEDEDGGTGEGGDLFGSAVAEIDGLQSAVAFDGGDFGAVADGDVAVARMRADEVFGHSGTELAADDHVDAAFGAAFGEVHGGLPGGVAGADDGDVWICRRGWLRRWCRRNRCRRLRSVRRRWLRVFSSGRRWRRGRCWRGRCAAVEVEEVWGAGGCGGFEAFDVDGGDHACAELEHLEYAAGGEVGAGETCREADEIFDARGAADLSAGAEAIEDEGVETFGGGVNGGGDSGGPRADDGEVGVLIRTQTPYAGGTGEFLKRGIEEDAVVAAEDDGRFFRRAELEKSCVPFGSGSGRTI